MTFDYKKYSLGQLENWMHDALSCGEATPQEIYDVIKSVVSENYHIYKDHAARCYELLALLNGNGVGHIQSNDKDDDGMRPWGHSDLEYQIAYVSEDGDLYPTKDKVVKWQLPVQVDGLTGDCYINLPDDLLERAGLKEGDTVEWIDRNDGSFELRKVNVTE